MRTTLFTLIIALFIIVPFVGCDTIENITQTDVGLDVSTKSLTVDQPSNSFSSADSVDLSKNQTYKDNKTRIKKLHIDAVLMTLTVRQPNGADILQSASANISKLDG